MKSLLWTGKLSMSVKFLVNANNILAWLTGSTNDKEKMKARVKLGYEGKITDHIANYDELSSFYQKRAAISQIDGLDFRGKEVIDIGCGTGILAILALDAGAANVVCGDISEYMLRMGVQKSRALGYDSDKIQFRQLDAESLPFKDNSFDMVLSGMAFGLFPDQEKAASEMYRVLRPGGYVSIGAHGPEHYWEAIDANIRVLNKMKVLGYRFEFWPRSEKQLINLIKRAGFKEIRTCRFIWRNLFNSPDEACDFFSAVSSNWWYVKVPEKDRARLYLKTRSYFERNDIRVVTDDIIVAYGSKA